MACGCTADYAIVAEGTGVSLNWVEAGKLFLKVRVFGADPPVYTPYVTKPERQEAPSAVVRAAAVTAALERWSARYECEYSWRGPGGVVVPKASINAIRGGLPHKVTKTLAVCDVFLDVRLNPDQRPRGCRARGRGGRGRDRRPGRRRAVPLPARLSRHGRRAARRRDRRGAPRAHGRRSGGADGPSHEHAARQQRFIEAGIPTVAYGPDASTAGGKFAIDVAALDAAARIYAATILRVCGVAADGTQP